MIDRNIKIGLHGHQHVCGIVNEFKNVFEDKKIVLFSAGTLYGYKESLPYGTNRQYNIIEINTIDEEMQYEITIHSREDVDKLLFDIPSWDKGRIDKTSDSSWKTLINKPKEPNIIEILSNIMEETEKDGDFRSAVMNLKQLDLNNIMVRKVLCDYLERLDDDLLICELLIEPKNNAEAILLMNSAIEINNRSVMEKIIQIPLIATSSDAAIKKLREYLIYQLNNHGTN
jgi:hypothetical protein